MARFTLPKNALLFCRWREVITLGSRDLPASPRLICYACHGRRGRCLYASEPPRSARRHLYALRPMWRGQWGGQSTVTPTGMPLSRVCRSAPLPLTPILYHNDTQKSTPFFKKIFDRFRRQTSKFQQDKKGVLYAPHTAALYRGSYSSHSARASSS